MKRLSLLAVSMLLTCTLFAADIFLRGSVNGWGTSDDFKFATSDNVVYTLEKSFDLFGEFKFADANWGADNYGSGGGAVELDTPLKLVLGGGNFSCGSNSYKVTKIVLNLLENSATIYGEGGELEITSRTVAGDDTGIFGTAWDPENTANDMVKDGSTWKLVKENVSLVSGTEYLFKIVANHAWGVSDYPEDSSNASFTVSQSGAYDVNFEYDETTNTGKAYATKKSEPTTFDSYILVGDGELFVFDWTPSPMGTDKFTLETTDGIHYTKTVNGVPLNVTGTFAYGFSKNGSTTDIIFKDKSHTVTIKEAATYNITVALTVAPGEEPDAKAELTKVIPGTTYYIAGNGDAETDWCCGLSWNEKGCPMESGYFTRDLPAGEYKFKITDGTWDNNWGYDAVDAAQSTAGYTSDADGNVVFTLETLSAVAVKFDGSKIALQWTAKDEPVVFDTWSLIGDMPPFPKSWTILPGFDLQTEDGKIYTLSAETEFTVTEFEYGFRKNYTEEYAPLAEKYTATLAEGTGEYKVDIALDFTDAANPKVSVKFTKIPEPPVGGVTVNVEVPEGTPSCFFYGAFSGNSFVEMTKVDGTHYTINFPDKSPSDLDWGYKFCWESNNWDTQAEPETTYDITDGSMCVVLGWKTQPGTEYHYTTYTDWQVRTDWNGSWDPETWLTLTPNVDGTFSGLGEWGTGEGVNLASNDGPVKKNWYAANDPDITIEPGLEVGTQVRFTLTVISDDKVNILVENANPTSADEAVEDSIYATNGTVFCSTPFEVYNLVGQNVTAQNGSLFGIYIVKTAKSVKTISVK